MGSVGQECPTYGEAQQATSGLDDLSIVIAARGSLADLSGGNRRRGILPRYKSITVYPTGQQFVLEVPSVREC